MDIMEEPGIRLSCDRPVMGTVLQADRESSHYKQQTVTQHRNTSS